MASALANNPFANLLPPLSREQFAALKADIKAHGVRQPIDVDEDGNILDGHHRYKIDKDAPRKVVKGLTEAEKKAHVYRNGLNRRNLSVTQKKHLLKQMKATAKELRDQDHKTYTQLKIAGLLGVDQSRVSRWLARDTSIMQPHSTCEETDDAKVKVPPTQRRIIVERLAAGETQAQVATDYGVTQQQISTIAKKEEKQQDAEAERKKAVKKLGGETLGIHHGDFRKLGKIIEDNSVDLIFTDPPYDEKSVSLYGDLAEFAARTLKPGGWCLAYSGMVHIPAVIDAMREHLTWGWMFSILHTGGHLRIRKFKVLNTYKPVLGWYKPPLNAWWQTWFNDSVAGAKEKTEHEWQQAVSEATHYVQALAPEGGLVVDCFVGSGTTALAASELKRQFVGFEENKATAEAARVRLTQGCK